MTRYDSKANMASRTSSLCVYGHNSSVWSLPGLLPPKTGHIIELLNPSYVSRPCLNELIKIADSMEIICLDFQHLVDGTYGIMCMIAREWFEYGEDLSDVSVYQFSFSDYDTAKGMALRVQTSARNKRKDKDRRYRLDAAGGYHNKQALDRLFEIQRGRCYYSGDPLTKSPKNYVIDHISPIYLGGTDWPINLALVIKEINTWKGGLRSKENTLQWLAMKRGKGWLLEQKAFCKKVDRMRKELDVEFRSLHPESDSRFQ